MESGAYNKVFRRKVHSIVGLCELINILNNPTHCEIEQCRCQG